MNTIFVHSTMNIIFVYSFLCQLHFLNYVISCFLSSLRGHIICEGSNEVGCFWKVLRFFFYVSVSYVWVSLPLQCGTNRVVVAHR